MKQILIACSMMEDEINFLYDELKCEIPIVWLERGYHNSPEKLKEKIQELINGFQEYDEILLTFGLCGNGTAGIVSEKATLILPKFDDCINMLLCNGNRSSRGLTEASSIYLTRGWIKDKEAILSVQERYVEQYGEEAATDILKMMYEHYESISVLDTGSYDLGEVQEYAKKTAELLGLKTRTVPGFTEILRRLLTRQWEEHFIIQPSGKPLKASQWEI